MSLDLKSVAYRTTHPLLKRIRGSRTLIRRLTGVRVPAGTAVDFDPTTVLLAIAVREAALPGDRSALEVGVGAGALAGLSVAKATGLALTGCDCVARRVESARVVAQHNRAPVRLFVSDLFDGLPAGERFDLIFFNPPYVPTEVGDRLNFSERLTGERSMWDGGDDGLQVLRRFLAEAPPRMAPGARVVFGVQHVFTPDAAVRGAIDASPFELVRRVTRWWLPSAAYVLRAPARA
ncbi:N5-glutamine S-adenosyl-L-methionine-dependent methyltransferase [Pirellulimonas nuda]|uniref:N5-glutamine S-adenosyl-L-methionine-dependent methyltransferase n=1 Tax=Pirellulimonas nuda TaxID=2528009 RepID=A0A518DIG6_9BACT|nr:methyltransferase [Pirellulimonas nuda]QDU91280.1 N5-glutamine S-adenosyl-L-methionine-dependent methyltransferase [Pirellulimonas nuda]